MRSLEEIARDSFMSYSKKKYGKKVPWGQLSDERKAAWMEEVGVLLQELIKELEMALKAPENVSSPRASFDAGFVMGADRERRIIKNTLTSTKEKVKEELKKFLMEKL